MFPLLRMTSGIVLRTRFSIKENKKNKIIKFKNFRTKYITNFYNSSYLD